MPDETSGLPGAAPRLPIHQDPQIRRLLVVGLLSSMIRWLEILAFGVFTYQQTESAFWVASMTMLRMLPMGLFGVAFGALAARISRRTGLLVSQGALFATTLVLLAVSLAGALEVWHLAVGAFINGTVWAGDMSMRRGLIGELAGASRMARAMAFDAASNNGCRLVGPTLGGVLLAAGSMQAVFIATTLLYVVALGAVLRLAEPPAIPGRAKAPIGAILAGGFQAARASPRLKATLYITLIFNIFGWPVLSMVPVIGQARLGLGEQGIGVLASMDGLGALLGSILMMSLGRRAPHGVLYVGGVVLFLAMLPVFAISTNTVLTGLALLAAGIGQSGFGVMQATLVFVSAPPERRAEAMGLLTMCIGTGPVGFLAVGWLAGQFGAPAAALIASLGGLCCMALTWPWWRLCLREPQDGARP